ncbi:hypothetical protein [Burkholderia vietnamiensis]|uniref:hypothetical protein n=1 Tax=Burkholderia vietnamiensis TaxID=60552 RepID=UPI001B9243B6|nr:hypothetical protein [Burkholderia vietnamiensis]MBR8034484.1 hypothetical protein [Burkholderia vietnamiensis]HDR9076392.1 hypothetical protein [Burkholderia vietnamiensis]
MKSFSKSKLIAYRQCPKRLWLEIHRNELRADSESSRARIEVGYTVGNIAKRLYDPDGKGIEPNAQRDGYGETLSRSMELLRGGHPLFEAGFSSGVVYAFADVMLPVRKDGRKGWRMVEVKSSSSVKDYHRDDAAIQSFAARGAGVLLVDLALAHIDTENLRTVSSEFC